jgi:hypothetical protein
MQSAHQPQPVGAERRSSARVAGLPERWLWLSGSAAGVAAAGSIIGLVAPGRHLRVGDGPR